MIGREITQLILSFIDYDSLFNLSKVNKEFFNVSRQILFERDDEDLDIKTAIKINNLLDYIKVFKPILPYKWNPNTILRRKNLPAKLRLKLIGYFLDELETISEKSLSFLVWAFTISQLFPLAHEIVFERLMKLQAYDEIEILLENLDNFYRQASLATRELFDKLKYAKIKFLQANYYKFDLEQKSSILSKFIKYNYSTIVHPIKHAVINPHIETLVLFGNYTDQKLEINKDTFYLYLGGLSELTSKKQINTAYAAIMQIFENYCYDSTSQMVIIAFCKIFSKLTLDQSQIAFNNIVSLCNYSNIMNLEVIRNLSDIFPYLNKAQDKILFKRIISLCNSDTKRCTTIVRMSYNLKGKALDKAFKIIIRLGKDMDLSSGPASDIVLAIINMMNNLNFEQFKDLVNLLMYPQNDYIDYRNYFIFYNLSVENYNIIFNIFIEIFNNNYSYISANFIRALSKNLGKLSEEKFNQGFHALLNFVQDDNLQNRLIGLSAINGIDKKLNAEQANLAFSILIPFFDPLNMTIINYGIDFFQNNFNTLIEENSNHAFNLIFEIAQQDILYFIMIISRLFKQFNQKQFYIIFDKVLALCGHADPDIQGSAILLNAEFAKRLTAKQARIVFAKLIGFVENDNQEIKESIMYVLLNILDKLTEEQFTKTFNTLIMYGNSINNDLDTHEVYVLGKILSSFSDKFTLEQNHAVLGIIMKFCYPGNWDVAECFLNVVSSMNANLIFDTNKFNNRLLANFPCDKIINKLSR